MGPDIIRGCAASRKERKKVATNKDRFRMS
jgi:hypothetical protein